MLTAPEEVREALITAREQLIRSVRDLPAEALATRSAPDEWSILDVLAHIVDVDGFYLAQALTMKDSERHLFRYFDDEAWKLEQAGATPESLEEVMQRLEASQAEVLNALARLDPADLDRGGRHPRGIDYCVRDVFLRLPAHDIAHRRQVSAILRSLAQPGE